MAEQMPWSMWLEPPLLNTDKRIAGINLVDGDTVFSPRLEFSTQTFGELLPRLASSGLSKRATATAA
jgi:hypothetical protein